MASNHSQNDVTKSRAEELLARFQCGSHENVAQSFEALCAEHPDLAEELRRLNEGVLALKRNFSFFGSRSDRTTPSDLGDGARVGDTVGDFELISRIARGGQGEVWEAQQLSMERRVALKLVLPGRINERSLSQFAREARAGGRLSHPGIVAVHGHGEDDGRHWIAQELVEGAWTLRDFIDEVRNEAELPTDYYRSVAHFLSVLGDALEAAHGAGIIHRDVKPQNVLVTKEDHPKLTDFGLARITDEAAVSVTGDFAGTWLYMSPEQVTAKRIELDHRTDIFSLGVVMYEMLALQRPFDGDTTHQIAEKIIYAEPPSLTKLRSRIPHDLAVICGKALEKRKSDRYRTMAEFAEDLRRWLGNEPIHATPPTRMDRAVKWCKRNPTKSVAAGLVSVAFIVILWLALSLSKSNDSLRAQTALAEGRAVELEEEREALANTNTELELKTALAEEQTALAENRAEELEEQRATLAKTNEDLAEKTALAEAQERIAKKRLKDILSLSASKDLEGLVTEADELWPPHPDMIPRYEAWLANARLLLDGRSADEEHGIAARPSLAEHQLKLGELRSRSHPVTDSSRLAAAREHESHPALKSSRAQLTWYSRMLGRAAWPDESETEAALALETLPATGAELNELAWSLVDPAAPAFGQELRALLLARRALEAASDETRASVLDTLAWANFRAGRLDEAVATSEAAVALAGDDSLEASHANLLDSVGRWQIADSSNQLAELQRLEAAISELELVVGEREFADAQDAWWHRQLSALVRGIEGLHDAETGLAGETLAYPFGWGVAKRLSFAKTIEERSVTGPDAKRLWTEASAAIASSPKYSGLTLAPQMGLLPIGPDPASGLWEFAHLMTGEPAVRGADGKLLLTEATGLVLVLIPDGTFQMGAQSAEPDRPNYDPRAESDEGPVHPVSLSAYLLSKYEMTQGQWLRATGKNPSRYQPPGGLALSLLHPVEQVSWVYSMTQLPRLGLSLPSEAQWEYGARAGTSTSWWTGQDRESLRGKVNLADQTAKNAGATWSDIQDWPDLEDGAAVHSEVGFYSANGFGLHEVAGNLWEWCLDGYDQNAYGSNRPQDPVVSWEGSSARVSRGGSFVSTASNARSALRYNNTPGNRDTTLGLRPAQGITP